VSKPAIREKQNCSNTILIFVTRIKNMEHIYFRGPPVVIPLTCDCAVADDAVMQIRAESSL